jgi:hypothetical protein
MRGERRRSMRRRVLESSVMRPSGTCRLLIEGASDALSEKEEEEEEEEVAMLQPLQSN